MKRSPLKRKTPLRSRSKRTKYARRPRALGYMQWVKTQPCSVRGNGECGGPVEADHAGARGIGQKAPDATCIPLCRKHHRERTDMHGCFADLGAQAMRIWCDQQIEWTQRDARESGIEVPSC